MNILNQYSYFLKRGILFFLFLFLHVLVKAQIVRDWAASYGPNNSFLLNEFWYIASDQQSNLYAVGAIDTSDLSDFEQNYDFLIIKYNPDGSVAWIRQFDNEYEENDFPYDVAVDSKGDVYVTGSSSVLNTNTDYLTVKYDEDGAFQWARTFGGSLNWIDIPSSIAIDKNDDVYITGFCKNTSNDDAVTIKYNSDGVVQWITPYVNAGNDNAQDICVGANGNVYIAGWALSKTNGDLGKFDYLIIKYNSTGEVEWSRQYDCGDGGARKIISDHQGNIYVAGWANCSLGSGTECIKIVKYNSDGINEFTITEIEGDFRDMIVDENNNLFVVDYSYLYKYNAEGVKLWESLYNNGFHGHSLALNENAEPFVLGLIQGSQHLTTVQFDKNDGTEKWRDEYAVSVTGYEPDITINNNAIYVSQFRNTANELILLKYTQSLVNGLPVESIEKSIRYYPNPAIEKLTIEWSDKAEIREMYLLDVTGRKVWEQNVFGINKMYLNTNEFSEGVYFVQLNTDQRNYLQKIIIQ